MDFRQLGVILGDIELPEGTYSGVTADSRAVNPGDIFVAMSGTKTDGAKFADAAVAAGAVAVIAAPDAVLADVPVPIIRHDDPRRALALIAASLAGLQPEIMLAVTGTAGKTSVLDSHAHGLGLTGPTGTSAANALAADADVVLCVGTRLQDFTTGSWSCFQNPDVKLISINAAAFDATKHGALSVVADAKMTLQELDGLLGDWRAPEARMAQAQAAMGEWRSYLEGRRAVTNDVPRYSEVVGAIH
ncbi:MAG: Mur ligase domain-containing protein, partial [Pseudomonadota bacterium]